MSRYLFDLKNLYVDLRCRYGENDDVVQQVRHQVETVEAAEAEHQELLARGRARSAIQVARHGWEACSTFSKSAPRSS